MNDVTVLIRMFDGPNRSGVRGWSTFFVREGCIILTGAHHLVNPNE
jgi:hypothetical protein